MKALRILTVAVTFLSTTYCQAESSQGLSALQWNKQMDAAVFNPLKVEYPVLTDERFSAKVVRGSAWPLRIVVLLAGGRELALTLPDTIEQVKEMHLFRNRFIVQGMLDSSDAANVAAFDIVSGRLVDQIWCRAPVFSPDESKMALVRFYTAHFVTSVEDQEFVYYFGASSTQNRPRYPADFQEDRTVSPERDAGIPIYPLSARELGRENVNLDRAEVHRKLAPFAWSPDSRRVAFLDAQGGKAAVVVTDTHSIALTLNDPQFVTSRVDTRSAPLAGLSDVCDVQRIAGIKGKYCRNFIYDNTYLTIDASGVTLTLAGTNRSSLSPLTMKVLNERFAPVTR